MMLSTLFFKFINMLTCIDDYKIISCNNDLTCTFSLILRSADYKELAHCVWACVPSRCVIATSLEEDLVVCLVTFL